MSRFYCGWWSVTLSRSAACLTVYTVYLCLSPVSALYFERYGRHGGQLERSYIVSHALNAERFCITWRCESHFPPPNIPSACLLASSVYKLSFCSTCHCRTLLLLYYRGVSTDSTSRTRVSHTYTTSLLFLLFMLFHVVNTSNSVLRVNFYWQNAGR